MTNRSYQPGDKWFAQKEILTFGRYRGDLYVLTSIEDGTCLWTLIAKDVIMSWPFMSIEKEDQ